MVISLRLPDARRPDDQNQDQDDEAHGRFPAGIDDQGRPFGHHPDHSPQRGLRRRRRSCPGSPRGIGTAARSHLGQVRGRGRQHPGQPARAPKIHVGDHAPGVDSGGLGGNQFMEITLRLPSSVSRSIRPMAAITVMPTTTTISWVVRSAGREYGAGRLRPAPGYRCSEPLMIARRRNARPMDIRISCRKPACLRVGAGRARAAAEHRSRDHRPEDADHQRHAQVTDRYARRRRTSRIPWAKLTSLRIPYTSVRPTAPRA